jgi:beta-lactamase superfamily II metal-dependent hydrolase
MSDYFEIDFLDVEADKSGDAICLRYEINGATSIHVVDAGFQATGQSVVDHIRNYYGNPTHIHRVVVSHSDGDHAGGVRAVLEQFSVGELWMLRPWLYASEIIDRFANYSSAEALSKRLKSIYENIAALEEIALNKRIPIFEPFQGAAIGQFRVLAPSKSRYLDLIVQSDKTPESVAQAEATKLETLGGLLEKAARKVAALVKAAWGVEVFSPEETSAENEMSVVQYALLNNDRILLTADAGRRALAEAANYAGSLGMARPNRFQIPHHGSRRNVSTEVLDQWLGPRMVSMPSTATFSAIVSSAKKDEHHPRKSVVRALIHRGATVYATEGKCVCWSENAPDRGWSSASAIAYPEENEA